MPQNEIPYTVDIKLEYRSIPISVEFIFVAPGVSILSIRFDEYTTHTAVINDTSLQSFLHLFSNPKYQFAEFKLVDMGKFTNIRYDNFCIKNYTSERLHAVG